MTILEFRHDRNLLGGLPHMQRPETQARWDAFIAAVYGLPLDDAAVEYFREHTGRTMPRAGGYAEAVIITGRQSGKTQAAGDLLAFEAACAPRDPSVDGVYCLAVAQDARGAMRTLLKYATTPFDRVPILVREATGARTADSLTLRTGITIGAYPCRPAAIRGIRARIAVVDELAFFRTSDGNPVDTEMLRAVRPTLATTRGKLIVLSSPYGQTGALWELHRTHFGREDSGTLVWVAGAAAMNPTLPADYLQRMEQDDPEAYRSEVLGEFRAGIATFLDPEALANVIGDYRELPPGGGGIRRGAFFDPSGGQRDAAALAIGRRDGEHVTVELVRAWPAPHNPEVVIGEAAAILRSYGCLSVSSDRYAGQFPARALERHKITLRVSELDRSALYVELLPRVLSQTVTIPNDPALLRELRGLERRRGFAGKDRVDHRPGSHDDRANALAGVVAVVGRRERKPLIVSGGW